MKILITGSNGFIGRNLVEQLQGHYEIIAPNREQLDLMNTEQTEEFLKIHKFDLVIHSANVNATRRKETMPYDSLNGNLAMFCNLERCKSYFGKMYYFGSGAEYDVRHYIPQMKENYFGTHIPIDAYGFSKYIMAKMSEQNNNIYDFVLFGVFGKYEEWERRFISNNICKNIRALPMTINQNMYFDYIDVDDLIQIMRFFIENEPKQKRYNICRGDKIDLLLLAQLINKVMNKKTDIIMLQTGWKLEYTGDNTCFLKETNWKGFIPFEDSIEKLLAYYTKSGSFCIDV